MVTNTDNISGPQPNGALAALAAISAYYRVPADPEQIARELSLQGKEISGDDIIRAAQLIGFKARVIEIAKVERFSRVPVPAIAKRLDGVYLIFGGKQASGKFRFVNPANREAVEIEESEIASHFELTLILVSRKLGGAGVDPQTFNLRWFFPSIWRYRKPLAHVMIASLFVQIFALVTPLIFQVVIDKVLSHKGYETLFVMVAGILFIGIFDRIDVELGRRLFFHLFHLPMSYFETRSAGQTVARVRELETIRSFLTGQGLFSALDLFFTIIFIIVMLFYSWQLTLIVVLSIPLYLLIAAVIRPVLRELVKEKFNRGALSQQMLVEAIVGAQTIKSAAVEPAMQVQWEEKLAAFVTTSFDGGLVGSGGQMAIQYINKATSALLLLFGAKAVIEGDLTVGELVAFNMISGQVAQPILRLSQIWQDFQQVQISIDRLGDILNHPMEPLNVSHGTLPRAQGAIEFRNVTFRYAPGAPEVLKGVSLFIAPGEVVGIVGRSGSGKSTLAKLIQRFYIPESGQVLVDGVDLAQVNPAWLRSQIGVVLQDNLLFNRTVHDNIALANPAMPRAGIIQVARLSGADEFIGKLANGYDTVIEERGANLSGGQRQRIAIARALSINPSILILDEATSALDYESEKIIQNNMMHIVKGRTVIIVAHRLNAVRNCTKIVGLHEGQIIEVGSHKELINKPGGLYAHLWSLQNALGEE